MIPMTKRPADARFMGVVALSFALLCVGWNSFIPYAPTTFISLNQAEENRARLVKHVLSKPAELVLAGTSLMYRLQPAHFSESVSNLAVAGQSPVIGAVIAERRPPPILIVETNILDRVVDEKLLADGILAADPPLGMPALGMTTTPVRSVVARWYDLDRKAEAQELRVENRGEILLAAPAAAPANDDAYSKGVSGWMTRRVNPEQIASSARAIKDAIDRVEAAGGNGYYLQMPLHESLEATPYSTLGLEELKKIDPKFDDRVLQIAWSPEIRWTDGAHLDDRSAVVVARQIDAALQAIQPR